MGGLVGADMKLKFLYPLSLVALIVGVVLTLMLLSNSTENSALFSRYFNVLLVLTIVGLSVLALIVGWELTRLINAYRRREFGVLLRGKLMLFFAIVAIIPGAMVYYVSNHFLQRGLDSWVNVEVEDALKKALALSQSAINLQRRDIDRQMRRALSQINLNDREIQRQLLGAFHQTDALSLDVFQSNGYLLGTMSYDTNFRIPRFPANVNGLFTSFSRTQIQLERLEPHGLVFRAVKVFPGNSDIILQGLFPVGSEQAKLADEVSTALDNYRELGYLKAPLKRTFSLVLLFVVLFASLIGLLMALRASKRITKPVVALASGTRSVAEGDYDGELASESHDELGDLVSAFNAMTNSLSETQKKLSANKQVVEQQHEFLATVMKRLSSGVMTIGQSGTLFDVNHAVDRILKFDLSPFVGANIYDLIGHQRELPSSDVPERVSSSANQTTLAGMPEKPELPAHIETFLAAIIVHIDKHTDWNEEIKLTNAHQRLILNCRGSGVQMPYQNQYKPGFVIVFDDISGLVQAQRNAAWGEVAQRLAHEVKNPLTPIQLSAERMERKLSTLLPEAEAQFLEKSVEVISRQVSSLKSIVTEFSDFAKSSTLDAKLHSIADVVEEVHHLFASSHQSIVMRVDIEAALPPIYMDEKRLRQVLNNLYKNAVEALESSADPQINASVTTTLYSGQRYIQLTIEDSGPGFNEASGLDYFEPYVTDKPKGTGIGLAVVKKIIEEHQGVIQIDTSETLGGATIVIYLPINEKL